MKNIQTTKHNSLKIKTILKDPSLQPILEDIKKTINNHFSGPSFHNINSNASAYILRILASMNIKDSTKPNEFSLYGNLIHSFRQYKPAYFPNISHVIDHIIIKTSSAYHRDSSTTGAYNGYTQTYRLTALGQIVMRILSPVDNFDRLELLSKDDAYVGIMVKKEKYNDFKTAIGNKIRNLKVIGRYKDCIVIENTLYSRAFNREYTTFSCMSKQAKELTELHEVFDCTKFAVRTLAQTWEFNFNLKLINGKIDMKRNYYSLENDHKLLHELVYNTSMYDFYSNDLLRGSSCKFHGIRLPYKELKLVLTAVSNGCRNYRDMIEKNFSNREKNTFRKYFEESSLYEIISSIIVVRKRLLDEIMDSKDILKLIGNKKGKKGIIARFVSHIEQKFRVVVAHVLKDQAYTTCHDAVFMYDKLKKGMITDVISIFQEIYKFSLELQVNHPRVIY